MCFFNTASFFPPESDSEYVPYTEKSVAFPDSVMCIGAMPLQNLFKQYDTYDFPNLKLIE